MTWLGEGGHAGAVLMAGRRDALCAAAEAVLAVEASRPLERQPRHRRDHGRLPCPPRCDQQHRRPGDPRNRRPRHRSGPPRPRAPGDHGEAIDSIAEPPQVAAAVECLNADPPAQTAGVVVAAIETACGDLGLKTLPMISRAYHDSLFMARIAPTGMIFIPCRGGVSHRPEEFSSPEAIARGVEVLALTLGQLARTEDAVRGPAVRRVEVFR